MRRSISRLAWSAAAAATFAASSRCTTDHDALAKKERDAGTDASGGSGGNAGSGGQDASAAAAAGGEAGDGKYRETPGRNVVTLLHGVADAQAVMFCFARAQGGDVAFVGSPLPQNGASFGRALVLESVEGVDLSQEAVATYVLAGDLSLLEGMSCEEAVAEAERHMADAMPQPDGAGGAPGGAGGAPEPPLPEPPALRVAPLPVVPAGTLSGGLSYLLVATGCIGGPWYIDENDDKVCGAGYDGTSTLAPVLVSLSRDVSLRLGLQAVHASRASAALDVRVAPLNEGVDPALEIGRDLVEGVIAPRPPRTDSSRTEYNVDSNVAIEVLSDDSVVLSEPWRVVLSRGDLEDVQDGRNYAFVVIGAAAELGVAPWWNEGALTIVDADPEPR